jgi:hypothetical protein
MPLIFLPIRAGSETAEGGGVLAVKLKRIKNWYEGFFRTALGRVV